MIGGQEVSKISAPHSPRAIRTCVWCGSRASCPPERSPPPALPRRGSTPATSPSPSAGPSRRPTGSRTSPGLAWRTLPYAFARAGRELSGPVAFELAAPSGERWEFTPDTAPATVIRGDGVELCLVAARRLDPAATALRGEGPDAAAVLELVRTYA